MKINIFQMVHSHFSKVGFAEFNTREEEGDLKLLLGYFNKQGDTDNFTPYSRTNT